MSSEKDSLRGEELTQEELQLCIARVMGEYLAEKRGEIIARAFKEIERVRGERGKEAKKLD